MARRTFRANSEQKVNLAQRARAAVGDLPDDGVPRVAFVERYMPVVDPAETEPLCRWLVQQGIIRIESRRGVAYVMRPSSRAGRPKAPDLAVSPAAVKMLQKVVPQLLLLAEMVERPADADWTERSIRHVTEHEALSKLETVVSASGIARDEVLKSMRLLCPTLLGSLLKARPEFPRVPQQPAPKRIANGLDIQDRVLEIIKRAGTSGATVSEIRHALPHHLRKEASAAIAMLGHRELIHSLKGRPWRRRGRVALRYFPKSTPLPRLISGERMVVDD